MRKLSEFKNEEALDLLADILEPMSVIMTDDEVVDKLMSDGQRMEGAIMLIKNYKPEIIRILAAMDQEDPETYEFNIFTLPRRILEIVNDKELLAFFMEQQTETLKESFGSAKENTKESEN